MEEGGALCLPRTVIPRIASLWAQPYRTDASRGPTCDWLALACSPARACPEPLNQLRPDPPRLWGNAPYRCEHIHLLQNRQPSRRVAAPPRVVAPRAGRGNTGTRSRRRWRITPAHPGAVVPAGTGGLSYLGLQRHHCISG